MSEVPPPPPESTPPGVPPTTPAAPLEYSNGGYPGPYNGPPPSQDDKTMGLLAHVLSIFTAFIGPLIIWLVKKDQSPFVADQGKEALNFQITVAILYFIGVATSCIGIGFIIITVVWVANLVLCIMAALAVNKGEAYRYPFALRLIK